MLRLPQLDGGPGGKNNEINNTGTVQRGTQPCPFLSPLPHTTACVKKNTFLSLLCLADHANASISFEPGGINAPPTPESPPSSWSPSMSWTHLNTYCTITQLNPYTATVCGSSSTTFSLSNCSDNSTKPAENSVGKALTFMIQHQDKTSGNDGQRSNLRPYSRERKLNFLLKSDTET